MSLEKIRSHYPPEIRAEVEALDRIERRWRKRRQRQFMAALVFLAVAYVAALVTTWMVGNSVAVFVILPLYGLLLAAFYGPFGWSLDGSLSRKSTTEKIGGK